MITSRPPGAEKLVQPREQPGLVGNVHERVAAPDDVERLGELLFENVSQQELTESSSELTGALVGDGDHFFGQIDANDLGSISLCEVKSGSADAAADVEHASPRAEGRAQPAQRSSVVRAPPVLM